MIQALKQNPYRHFTLVVAGSVLLIGLVLSLTAYLAISHYVMKDTVTLTESAVMKHFSTLPQLKSLFTRENGAGKAGSSYPETGHTGHDTANEKDTEQSVGDLTHTQLKGIISMHFGLYQIDNVRIYDKEGSVFFSYDKDEMKQKVSSDKQKDWAVAQAGTLVSGNKGNHLTLWIPIRDQQHAHTLGVVELERNISFQIQQIMRISYIFWGIIFFGMAVLFFSLRRVFVRSTRTINDKNRELALLLQKIEGTYNDSLQALSSALDSRDNETNGHSFRVTSYALRLGEEMGLSREELQALGRGALLHDVGKIGVPDAILRKPDKLTEEEWAIMKQHVHIGYQMLKHIEFLRPSLDVVKYHHERWDGNGYPSGLKEEEIPLMARIFALCDTYDAITSDRPYRKGRGYEEAKEEIVRHKGTQFDPQVVEAFLRIPKEEWMRIQQMSADSDTARMSLMPTSSPNQKAG